MYEETWKSLWTTEINKFASARYTIKILIYLKDKNRQQGDLSHMLLRSPNVSKICGEAGLKLGPRNSVLIVHECHPAA